MRCWLTRACRRMGWTWLENLSSGRPEGQGAALSLVVRYYYLACTYIRSPILRSCCRQARLSYTPPINRWLAQSKNWLSSNLSINFKVKMGRWAVKGMSSHKWSGVRSHRSQHKSFLAAAAAAAAAYLFWTHSNHIFHVARSFWLPLDVGYITNQLGKKIGIENSVFNPPLLKLCYFSQNLLCSSYECSWLPNLVFVNHYTIRYGAWNELPSLTVITSSSSLQL